MFFGCFFFFFLLFHIFCLWFDLHRHLFLLVLFLLCGCDYNQEMEIQKSTCCHSKYVLFHLLTTLLDYPSPSCLCWIPVSFFSLHGFTSRAVLWSELTLFRSLRLFRQFELFLGLDGVYFRAPPSIVISHESLIAVYVKTNHG